MAKNFQILRDQLRADPASLAAIDEYRRAMEDAVDLAARRDCGHSDGTDHIGGSADQEELAEMAEPRIDLYITTLSEYVSELGGRLELIVVFPDETVRLFPRD